MKVTKEEVIHFIQQNQRWPTQTIESEKKLYNKMRYLIKTDAWFAKSVEPFRSYRGIRYKDMTGAKRKRKTLCKDIQTGLDLADLGGCGIGEY